MSKTNLYFMIRHTPFWAIPILVVAAEFAYVLWLRKKKFSVHLCIFFMVLSVLALSWYYYAGGPEHAVRKFMRWERESDI